MAEVCIVVPVLDRPHRVAPLIESVAAATDNYRLLFVATGDDTAELDALSAAGADWIVPFVRRQAGDYAKKINAALTMTTEPLIFTGADDLTFKPGWFEAAKRRMTRDVGVVGTNDLGNPAVIAGTHATHSLVARWYASMFGTFDQAGVIFHDGYDHNFCDVELVQTAMQRGAWAFAADAIVEHVHPSWKKADVDSTYQLGQAGWRMDARTWNIRRRRMIAALRPLPA